MAHRRRHHRTHRNPISARGAMTTAKGLLKPAAVGAAGALIVNGLVNYLPFATYAPSLTSGRMIYATKGALAVLLAMFGRGIPGIGRHAADLARGSLTVTLTDLGKDLALAYGGMNLSGTGFLNPGYIVSPHTPYNNGVMPQLPARLGYYVQGSRPRAVVQSALHGVGRTGMYVNWTGRR
jgi:uncharacterized membrane protein YeaQ/YmgE (transglycosylase-associated protein family)